jgi:hypothetical protein
MQGHDRAPFALARVQGRRAQGTSCCLRDEEAALPNTAVDVYQGATAARRRWPGVSAKLGLGRPPDARRAAARRHEMINEQIRASLLTLRAVPLRVKCPTGRTSWTPLRNPYRFHTEPPSARF